MAVHATVREAEARIRSVLGRIGLPQPWAPFGHRAVNEAEGDTNDCCFGFTWAVKDNGGRVRGDYRNGSIKALRADRKWEERDAHANAHKGDGVLLRWSNSGLPDHIGFVVSQNRDGSVNTLEFNSGPRVGEFVPCGVHARTRFRANIVGFIVPPYLKENA